MDARRPVVVLRVVLLVPFAAVLSCLSPPWVGSGSPWPGAEKFTRELRCGMSREDVSTQLRSFPSLDLHFPAGHEGLAVARHNDTSITLWFDEAGLRATRTAWTNGLTSTGYRHKHDLCSDLKLVELHLVGSRKDAGAAVLLDSMFLGVLSPSGDLTVDVPLGPHELRLDKEGAAAWSTKVLYEETSPGYDRLPIPDSVFEGE